jgi:phage gpG-like protein
MIQIRLDSKEFQGYLKGIQANIGNLRPFFEACVPIIHTSIVTNFRVGGRPGRWTPLSESWTVKQRIKEGTYRTALGQPILQRYGTLKASIGQVRIITNNYLEYGTGLTKAKPLQEGRPPRDAIVTVKSHHRRITQAWGRQISPKEILVREFRRRQHFGRLPARPFVLFQKQDVDLITEYASGFAFNPDKARQVLGDMRAK